MLDVDALAAEIRRVDGSNSLGAGALAEALMPLVAKDMEEAISLLESASVALWGAGRNSAAREIDSFLDRVSPESNARIEKSMTEKRNGF